MYNLDKEIKFLKSLANYNNIPKGFEKEGSFVYTTCVHYGSGNLYSTQGCRIYKNADYLRNLVDQDPIYILNYTVSLWSRLYAKNSEFAEIQAGPPIEATLFIL